mmetsp:Transcript_6901/g.22203  ORF Transcript_6901/g.22203 Transcript_6901/m.22203 type:complete len:468 (-) Transcript_6901:30-1433(-)
MAVWVQRIDAVVTREGRGQGRGELDDGLARAYADLAVVKVRGKVVRADVAGSANGAEGEALRRVELDDPRQHGDLEEDAGLEHVLGVGMDVDVRPDHRQERAALLQAGEAAPLRRAGRVVDVLADDGAHEPEEARAARLAAGRDHGPLILVVALGPAGLGVARLRPYRVRVRLVRAVLAVPTHAHHADAAPALRRAAAPDLLGELTRPDASMSVARDGLLQLLGAVHAAAIRRGLHEHTTPQLPHAAPATRGASAPALPVRVEAVPVTEHRIALLLRAAGPHAAPGLRPVKLEGVVLLGRARVRDPRLDVEEPPSEARGLPVGFHGLLKGEARNAFADVQHNLHLFALLRRLDRALGDVRREGQGACRAAVDREVGALCGREDAAVGGQDGVDDRLVPRRHDEEQGPRRGVQRESHHQRRHLAVAPANTAVCRGAHVEVRELLVELVQGGAAGDVRLPGGPGRGPKR